MFITIAWRIPVYSSEKHSLCKKPVNSVGIFMTVLHED